MAKQIAVTYDFKAGATRNTDASSANDIPRYSQLTAVASSIPTSFTTSQITDYNSVTDGKITTAVSQAKTDLLNGAGAAYDTFKELQDLIVADQTSLTSVSNALAGKAGKYTTTIGDGSATTFVVTHNLGNDNPVVKCRDSTGVIEPSESAWSSSAVTLTFTGYTPASAAVKVTVIG